MSCEAKIYADGSWFCQKCGIGGDKDEPVEEFCKLTRSDGSRGRGSYAANRSPVDQQDLDARLAAHAAKNREAARR